ncbi:MAG: class I SAM-dependent methyltransferase [Bacillota bacterium]|jgi:protein-L-isoaspartate O-methyltransferase
MVSLLNSIKDICNNLELQLPITSRQIFTEFNLLSGHPWEETAKSDITTYYPCLYGITKAENPRKILEIGTAFGMSAATLLKASHDIELFISIDLGIYGDQLGFSSNNIDFARYRIHSWCCQNGIPLDRVRFYRANTQPAGKGDNENAGEDILRWHRIPELVRLLTAHEFDLIFVDGKHTEDGLLNDLTTFWPFLKPGGLMICDDLHDEDIYKDIFPWAGDTLRSFEDFLKTHGAAINDSYIWNFPQVPPESYLGLRPFGLIRKKPLLQPLSTPGFEMFNSPDAIKINRARQDHLASLGLDLVAKSVLEVGAGFNWHRAFFEKLGCSVVSTDARPENVKEHLRQYPYRKVKVADFTIPSTHKHLEEFDVVYCYGILHHLHDPALCIKELSKNCRRLFLLETCVNPYDNGSINLVNENRDNQNQSFHGIGCRPGRDWVMAELKRYFPFVYVTVYQPDHPDFPSKWPVTLPPGVLNVRSVFVASRVPLNLPTLSETLLEKQPALKPILT